MEEVQVSFIRALPDLIVLALVLGAQCAAALWFLRRSSAISALGRRLIQGATVLSAAILIFGFLLRFNRVERYFPQWWPSWGRGLVVDWAVLSVAWAAALIVSGYLERLRPRFSSDRRHFLRIAQGSLFAAPAAALGYGTFIQRNQIFLREQRIESPNLPPDLDGIRIVQLTDIHLSPFLDRAMLDRAVAMANETRAHIALVTGDLITSIRDPLDECLDSLASLRSDAGILGCMGNHEIYARAEDHAEREGARRGIRFLRQSATAFRFGAASLNFAGVDYQRFGTHYLPEAEKMVQPGAFNVLLSHNPDVFPVAVRKGYDLTIAGHTHGGQVRVEILSADLNIARVFTPYVDGLYRQGASSIFVSRGIGTIGLPARLGAPPEVALIRLCRVSS